MAVHPTLYDQPTVRLADRVSPTALTYGDRHAMLIEADRAARRGEEVNGHRIHPFAVSVMMELDDCYSMREGVSRPSLERIAVNLGSTTAAVSRAISELVACGYVRREKVGRRVLYRFAGPLFSHHLDLAKQVMQDARTVTTGGNYEEQTVTTGDNLPAPTLTTGDNPHLPPVVTRTRSGKNPVPEPAQPTAAARPPAGDAPAKRRPSASKPQAATKPKPKPIPPDYAPTPEMVERAVREKGLTRAQVLHETEQFKAYHEHYGRPGKDWHKGWWYWMNNARPGGRFGARRADGPRPPDMRGPARDLPPDHRDDWLAPPPR